MQELLEKLEKAKFSGVLEIHFDRGQVVSAELHHWLVRAEFEKPIPTVEPGCSDKGLPEIVLPEAT